jgi:hypothetical protein
MGRYALLIGNNEYNDNKLHQLNMPEADVTALAKVLGDERIGAFDETLAILNPSWYEAQPAITKFFKDRERDDFLVMFFAGHGVKDSSGYLYLTFKDTELDDLDGTAIRDSFVARQIDRSRAESQLLILDCCYSGAFGRDVRAGLGASVGVQDAYKDVLSGPDSAGRMILTATDSIQFAWEGEEILGSVQNSLFTHFLIKGLQTGEADLEKKGVVTVDQLYDYVRRNVRSKTPNQEPQLLTRSGKHYGDITISFNPELFSTASVDSIPSSLRSALVDPDITVRRGAVAEAENLLSDPILFNPLRAILVKLAVKDINLDVRRLAIRALNIASLTKPSRITPQEAKKENILEILPPPFEWCKIPSGFIKLRKNAETYNVQPFSMAKYPITHAQFQAFIDADDGYYNEEWWKGLLIRHEHPRVQKGVTDKQPRVYVSWYEAIAFCRWLSSKLSFGVRLPTEWEWEWAASSQYGGLYPWGDTYSTINCNTKESGIGHITPVDHYTSGVSQFGVFDLSGNIWERCLNLYENPNHISLTGNGFRVIRGGSWSYPAKFARTNHRHLCIPERRFNDGGFRIVADIK